MRHWRITKCTVEKSGFALEYDHANITIDDSTFMDMTYHEYDEIALYSAGIIVLQSDIYITGNVLFSNMTNGRYAPYFDVVFSNVSITGDITFSGNKETPITAYSGIITLSGNVSFLNNTGTNGGAMALYSSTLNIASSTSVYFYNNSAIDTGGAIYVTRDEHYEHYFSLKYVYHCSYQLLDYNEDNWYDIQFVNNSAKNGGDHIYGEYIHSDTCYVTTFYDSSEGGFNPLTSYPAQKIFFL